VLTLLDPILDSAGIYGDPNAGDAIQYDTPRIEHDQGVKKIVVKKHAIDPVVERRRAAPSASTG